MYAFPFSLMYLLFCTDFYIFRNFVFFVFLVVQYRRRVIYKIKRLDTNTRDFGYKGVTRGYKALQGVTGGYKGSQQVTGGYKGLQEVKKG